MKLLIDIPEEIVTAIQNGEDYRYDLHTTIAQGIPYEPKGDLISREALKEAVYAEFGNSNLSDAFNDIIDNVPTVAEDYDTGYQDGLEDGLNDIRPTGKWIRKVDEVGFISHICSECGAEIEVEDPKDDKFCFSCGADMRKGGAEQ